MDSSKLVLINLVEPELVWSRQMGSKLVLVKLVSSMLVWFKEVRSKLVGSELEGKINNERKYQVDFSDSKMKMGTYHFLDGARVRVYYKGNEKTCGRCLD